MQSRPTEEKYPLLLLYVEENGKRSEFPRRVVFADKGRGKQLTKGAATIIAQWPAQVTSCWLTSLTLASAFVLLLLFMLITSLSMIVRPTHLRCTRNIQHHPNNQTIHLVKDGINWNQYELEMLEFIAKIYPDFNIHTTIIETSMKQFNNRNRKRELNNTKNETAVLSVTNFTTQQSPTKNLSNFNNIFIKRLNEFFSNKQLLFLDDNDNEVPDFLIDNYKAFNLTAKKRVKRDINKIKGGKSYEDILNEYTNIKEQKTTFKVYFINTALQYFWMDLHHEMLIFAIRTQELWQYGGISFYVPSENISSYQIGHKLNNHTNNTKLNVTNDNEFYINNLKTLITTTRQRFYNLSTDLVSIDGQGLHMASKIPCHSFFGEILIKLQHDIGSTTVADFIHKMLNVFCERGAVDSEYCKKHKK